MRSLCVIDPARTVPFESTNPAPSPCRVPAMPVGVLGSVLVPADAVSLISRSKWGTVSVYARRNCLEVVGVEAPPVETRRTARAAVRGIVADVVYVESLRDGSVGVLIDGAVAICFRRDNISLGTYLSDPAPAAVLHDNFVKQPLERILPVRFPIRRSVAAYSDVVGVTVASLVGRGRALLNHAFHSSLLAGQDNCNMDGGVV